MTGNEGRESNWESVEEINEGCLNHCMVLVLTTVSPVCPYVVLQMMWPDCFVIIKLKNTFFLD